MFPTTWSAILADLDEDGVGTFWVRLDSAAVIAGATADAKTKKKKGCADRGRRGPALARHRP
ncbi:hypothetical protein [Streptomyces sp. NPDC093795]|uniref:hypothetical protein n=1 Tax=Streptomyces sp. NPDC093795 TaxID=3366051 RepID=UPI0038123BE1